MSLTTSRLAGSLRAPLQHVLSLHASCAEADPTVRSLLVVAAATGSSSRTDKMAAVVLTRLVNVCAGAPASVESDEVPKHKKNPSVGTKKLLKFNKVGGCQQRVVDTLQLLCVLCSSKHGGGVSMFGRTVVFLQPGFCSLLCKSSKS